MTINWNLYQITSLIYYNDTAYISIVYLLTVNNDTYIVMGKYIVYTDFIKLDGHLIEKNSFSCLIILE